MEKKRKLNLIQNMFCNLQYIRKSGNAKATMQLDNETEN